MRMPIIGLVMLTHTRGALAKVVEQKLAMLPPMNAHRSFALVTVCSKLHMEHSDTKWQIVELAEMW